ncbi:glycosyltransferase family 4 protein [Candidatus Woesearchaeota archaeon]|nr:glycosyltransferase family 4 protein [bacterium]MBT7555540.1 glycosyltransferase family 4 protein [Candidatus Woesearchaeota archaeon]
MKILRLYTRLPPLLGGMENHIAQLTREQIKLGHKVSIYFNQGSCVTSNDIQITKLPLFKIKPQFIGLLIFHFLVLIRVFINKDRFDIVHIHGDWSSLVFSKLIKILVRADKVVITIHDQISDKLLQQKALAIGLRFVDIIFTTGYETANQLEKLTTKNITVQPSGVNEIFFEKCDRKLKQERLQVITIANLVKKKNLGLILDIARKMPLISFIIVGSGKEKRFLLSRIENENISNVKILGHKNLKELQVLYCQSDIFMLTSTKEGTPTSILEAMASGLPIISSNVGGVKSILGKHNCVAELSNQHQFIDCLSKFSLNIKLRRDVSVKNRMQSKKYAWKNVAENINLHLKG